MLFNSAEFLKFFLVVFAVYWLVRNHSLRILVLLAASYYFYMSWNAKLAAVVAASSLVDFFIARTMDASADERRRKLLLALSIVMNLGLLFYFKYMNFFLQSLQELLDRAGLHHQMPVLKVILPIGISFYTFEAISYTVDVYHRHAKAERNPLNFLLFITFFPRMVAGPIIRARNFLPQLKREKHFSWARFDLGLQFVLMGLFKKMVVADRMSMLVDPVYQSPGDYSTGAAWVAVVAYSLQVYGDFSGYSDIALGTAHMLGFKLPENFNMPYMARNIGEFWRRWHISLSTWIRDYVFIPLGGSRGTVARNMAVLLVTFALCGLWHGARWTFVAWGIVQGAMMVIHRLFRDWCKARPAFRARLETQWGTTLRVAVTYFFVCLGWVVFRAQDFTTSTEIFHRLFTSQHGHMIRRPVGTWGLVFSVLVVLVPSIIVDQGLWKKIKTSFTLPSWGFAYASLVVLICLLRTEGQKAFIYFQF